MSNLSIFKKYKSITFEVFVVKIFFNWCVINAMPWTLQACANYKGDHMPLSKRPVRVSLPAISEMYRLFYPIQQIQSLWLPSHFAWDDLDLCWMTTK